jgi:hypothetical protein
MSDLDLEEGARRRIIRRDAAAFWAFAERVSREIEQWPEWKRRAADAMFITPMEQRTEADHRRCPSVSDDGDGTEI